MLALFVTAEEIVIHVVTGLPEPGVFSLPSVAAIVDQAIIVSKL
jgi:hypothetical protein